MTGKHAPIKKGNEQVVLTIEKDDALRTPRTAGKKRSTPAAADKNLGPVRIYPHPLRSTGEIEIDLPKSGTIQAELQDLGGRKLAPLFSGDYDGTKQRIPVNVLNFPSGLYFCEVYVAGERFHRLITISR